MGGELSSIKNVNKSTHTTAPKRGTLNLKQKARKVFPFDKTSSVSDGVFRFLTRSNRESNGTKNESPWMPQTDKKTKTENSEGVEEVFPNLISEFKDIIEEAEELKEAILFVRENGNRGDLRELSAFGNLMPRVDANSPNVPPAPPKGYNDDDDVFLNFLALAEKIQQQAETDAQDLYSKMKYRSDCVELLTFILQQIRASKGDIDWSKNEEMRRAIDRARELGVVIPGETPGKEPSYKWKSSEVKNLEENIKMVKGSIDQATLLERTYMQKHLQEAAQWLEAMSGILKLRDRIMQTLASNISR